MSHFCIQLKSILVCQSSLPADYRLTECAKFGTCREVQKLRVYKNRHHVIQTSQQIGDAPYGDHFQLCKLYHSNAFHACCALYIANKFNLSSTYLLLELFFKNPDKFSNSVTSSLSSTAITSEMSKMAAQAVGNSVSEFQSGFSDVRTDLAMRVCFFQVWVHERGSWWPGALFFYVNGFLQPGVGSPIDYSTWVLEVSCEGYRCLASVLTAVVCKLCTDQ